MLAGSRAAIQQSGASLLEMALLIAILAMLSLAAVQQVGQVSNWGFRVAAHFAGGGSSGTMGGPNCGDPPWESGVPVPVGDPEDPKD